MKIEKNDFLAFRFRFKHILSSHTNMLLTIYQYFYHAESTYNGYEQLIGFCLPLERV